MKAQSSKSGLGMSLRVVKISSTSRMLILQFQIIKLFCLVNYEIAVQLVADFMF